jgi:ABC-type nickel/cobalt efflux system permease component RcnA
MDSPNPWIAIGLALLLGLRHATDPDHIVAVSTLVAGSEEKPSRAAAKLGGLWGIGHALALIVLGLPVAIAHASLPVAVQRLAETAIGAIIALLAIRLLIRWRRGGYHVHAHEHDGEDHTHFHAHAAEEDHQHVHVEPRTPLQAFLIGLTHGIGGSAAVALLLLASVPDRGWAVAALVIFAAGTAVSMGVLSGAWGWLLGTRPVRRRFRLAVLPLGLFGLVFGILYATAAWVPEVPLV